ncbi:FadR/GntR family transcriptional regulator [Virgibacillus halophilus]|uniref:FadR/GntR family transcriptional regulator n=1 Tax=Tigheibacillus halophilus TaxID=361280 RepID=UPI0036400C7A
MMLQKTNRISLVEQVAAQMEDLIESGHWSIGKKLPPEMELMEEFGVSRNTLREAIRALVHAGLLETKQGSGTTVRSSSMLGAAVERRVKHSDLIETLEVRLALEREAAQLAALRRTDKEVAAMQSFITECRNAAEQKEIEVFIKADIAFHKSMVKAAHNQLLLDLYDHMTDSLYSSIQNMMAADAEFDYDKEIHSELLEAIRLQDPQNAVKYVNEYIEHFKNNLQ